MSRLLPLLLLLVIPVSTWGDDLKDILDRDRLAVQKLVADVNEALVQAKASDPVRAKQILERASLQSRELS